MKCLRKFKWIKVRRNYLPSGKGTMLYWTRLASKAAFRKGKAFYCGHWNQVTPGMWSGGIVGLKSILGMKRRNQTLQIMNELQELGYIEYSLDRRTKHLEYRVKDWVMQCCGAESEDGTVYATDGYGFICVPAMPSEGKILYILSRVCEASQKSIAAYSDACAAEAKSGAKKKPRSSVM